MIFLYILLFFTACIILAKSGQVVVRSLTRIASYYHLSEFLVAFVLVSFATSAPELFVGVSSAISKSPGLSLGNLIGSNIINITLVIGLAAVLGRGIEISRKVATRDVYYTFIMLLLPMILLADQTLSRVDGLILVLFFLLYMVHLFYSYQRRLPVFLVKILNMLRVPINGEQFHQEFEALDVGAGRNFKETIGEFAKFILGFALIMGSAWVIVRSGINLAGFLNLPLVLLGLVIVSVGTTLPELTFGIRAVLAGKKEMILGNLFGAMVIHLVFILGIVALIQPIILSLIAFRLFLISSLFMFVLLGIFFVFIRSKSRLSWQEGLVLVMGYVVFVIVEFFMR